MEQKTRLQWHPAFAAVLRIELEKELGRLEIKDEVQLTKKPLQMDVLLIKKGGEEPVEKNIGRIFRRYNIIEYKSPGDSLSVNDFYKVYGYACIYQSDTDRVMEIRPQELTLTFVCSRFPRKLLEHLEKVRRMSVREAEKGIYYLEGDPIPIQLLVVPRLSKENNYWLQHLRGNLRRGREIEELMERYEEHSHSRWYQSAMDLIVRANWEKVKEEKDMCEALRELFADELRESWKKGNEDGLKAGAEKNMIALVCRKLKKSKSTHEISEALEEPEEKIRLICEAAADYAPDYDVDGIYDRLKEREAAL
ncbi:MAG TPA: 3-isopropylmalate dehydrogenase [Candidatus Dorea stercoravium]|nr:3-isopropylmalate dehydrogenase [Candidatus Dorea stercoravium]